MYHDDAMGTQEQDSFIASQIADFTNDKTLYHKFLEEVSNPKILLEQTANESFALVQIMVKAGLQLLGEDENLESSHHEALFSRSLSAVQFVISENQCILFFRLQSGAVDGQDELWYWLLQKLAGLLRRGLSTAMAASVVSVMVAIVKGLQKEYPNPEAFYKALEHVFERIKHLERELTRDTGFANVGTMCISNNVLTQLRLYAILFTVLCCAESLEHISFEPHLIHRTLAGLVSLLTQGPSTLLSSPAAEACLLLLMSIARDSLFMYRDQSWGKLASYILTSCTRVVPATVGLRFEHVPVKFTKDQISQLSSNLKEVLNALSQHYNLLDISVQAAILSAISESATIFREYGLECFSDSSFFTHQKGTRGAMIAPANCAGPPMASIFKKREIPSKSSHPLFRQACERLDVQREGMTSVLSEAAAQFSQLDENQQHFILKVLRWTVCCRHHSLMQVRYVELAEEPFACITCDNEFADVQDSDALDALDLPSETARDLLITLSGSDSIKQSVVLRNSFLGAWRSFMQHTDSYKCLDLNEATVARYINALIEDSSRQVRIAAGYVIPIPQTTD